MNFSNDVLYFILLVLIRFYQSTFIEVSNENFRKIENSSQVILYFYDSNCTKCDGFYETMNHVINTKRQNTSIIFAKINATMHPTLLFLYQISDLPTIIGLRFLNLFTYNYNYNSEGFSKFVDEIFINPVPQIMNKAEIEILISVNNSLVIGYFRNDSSVSAESYKTACLLVNYIKCVITSNVESISSILDTDKENNIYLVKHNNNSIELIQFNGSYSSVKEIKEFIQINDLPLIIIYNNSTKSRIFDNPIKLHLLLFVEKSFDFIKEIDEALKTVQGKAISIIFDINTSPEIEETLKIFDLKMSDIPTFVFIKIKDDEELKYPSFSKNVTSDNIIKFFNQINNGTRLPNFKSEILPDQWNASNVLILVRENFRNITENKNLTVFVNFYSPDCHHSLKINKIWTELGEYYHNNSNVIICQINSDLNEIDGFPIYSTPSIYLYRKDNKNPVRFDNERNLQNFIDFIENSGKESQSKHKKQNKNGVENEKDEL